MSRLYVDKVQANTTDGDVTLETNLIVSGNLDVTGNGNFKGNLTFGDASGDQITLNASTLAVNNNANFDSGTLYVDSSNNRIGIGTTSPAYVLDVDATGSAFRIKGATNGADVNCAIVNEGTASGDDSLLSIATEPEAGDPSLRFSIADGTEAWAMGIDNSDGDKFKISNHSQLHEETRVTLHNNKMGIGTAAPEHTVQIDANSDQHGLQVNGAQNKYTVSLRSNTTTGQAYGPYIRGGTNSSDVALEVDNASGGTTYFKIRGDGNVGIGHPAENPEYKLDIAPDISSALRIKNIFDGLDVNCVIENAGTGSDDGAVLSLTTQDGAADPSLRFAIAGNETWSMGIDNSDGDKFKISGHSNLATDTRITLHGPKVGIATDAPAHTLDVAGDVNLTGDLSFDASATVVNAILDEDDLSSNSATAIATQQSIKAYVDAQVTAQDLDLTTDSGTIAIDLDSETLTIAGTSNEIETSATSNTVTIGLPNDVTIGSDLTVTDDLAVNTNTLFVDASEDTVGIGTASPTYTLDVVPASSSALRIKNSTNGQDVNCTIENAGTDSGDGALLSIIAAAAADDPSLRFAIPGNETWSMGIDNSDNDKFKISQASTLHTDTRLTIQGNKVGIMDDSPSYTLDVTGTGQFTSNLIVGGNITVTGDCAVDGTANLDNTDIDGTLVVDGSNISLDSTSTLNIDCSNTSNGVTIATATSGVPVSIGHSTSEVTVNDNLTVTGDLTVNGTTTTVNSTTITVDDPIITLGGDTASGSDDNKDRGVEFRYNDGSDRIGFMGWDDSESGFTLLSAATNSSEVFSGTAAPLVIGALTAAAVSASGNLSTAGNLSVAGTTTLSDNVKIIDDKTLTFGTNDDWTIEYDENGDDDLVMTGTTLSVVTDTATFTSANSTDPVVVIKNTTSDANGPRLQLVKDKGAAGAANDVAGLIQFYADDAAQDQVMFSEIKSQVKVHTNGQEGGKLTISVAENDGTSTAGLVIEDGDADGELDATIGAGTSSVVTTAGNLKVTGNIIQNSEGTTTITMDTSENITVAGGIVATNASTFNASVSLGDNNITNVGDISLDSISSDGSLVTINAPSEIANSSTAGATALIIDNDDTDQVAVSIEAANIDADVLDITADAVTTANVIDISADALTTGALLSATVGAFGSAIGLKVKEEQITLATDATVTDGTSGWLPANSVPIALAIRVTTTIGNSAYLTKIGNPADDDYMIAAGGVLGSGVIEQAGDTIVIPWQPATTDMAPIVNGTLRFTFNAQPSAGVIRVAFYYWDITPPTS